MIKIISVIALSLFLTNCSLVGEKVIKVLTQEQSREKLNLKTPTLEEMEKLRWIVITSNNANEVFAKMKAEGLDPVLFGLSDEDYELLAKNFAQIRSTLKQTQDILDRYKEYYEGTTKTDNSTNNTVAPNSSDKK
jgi:hypothetical protein